MRQYIASLALQRFDRTAALHEGKICIPRVMVSQTLPGVSVRGLLDGTFDAAEMPLAHLVYLKSIGAPVTALPVFPDRLMLQQYIYTRPETKIASLQDLRGRSVVVPMYFMTSSIWHRGFLRDQTGITPDEIDWITTAEERDGGMTPPSNVSVTVRPASHLGLDRLLDGSGDCLMTEATPVVPRGREADVVPLFDDVVETQRDFFVRDQVHPIVHVVAVRDELISREPGIVDILCQAFDAAKASSYRLLQNERMVGLPLMRSYLDETQALFGDDPWPYGTEGRNGPELERFLRYAQDQGLTQELLSVRDLFAEDSLTFPWSARMERGADLGSMESLLGLIPNPYASEMNRGGDVARDGT